MSNCAVRAKPVDIIMIPIPSITIFLFQYVALKTANLTNVSNIYVIRLCPHNQCYTRNSLLSQKSCVIFPLAPEIMYNILLNIFDHLLFPEKSANVVTAQYYLGHVNV